MNSYLNISLYFQKFLFSQLLKLEPRTRVMFYYPNPLLVPGGTVRFPSLELPFSSNQPCKLPCTSKRSERLIPPPLQTRPSATPRRCTTSHSSGGSRGGTGRHSPSSSSRSWRRCSTRLTTQMSSQERSSLAKLGSLRLEFR